MQADRSVRVGNLHKLPDWSNNLVCPRLSWHMFRKELTTDELIRWAGTLLPRVACIWRSSGRPKRHSMTCVRNLIGAHHLCRVVGEFGLPLSRVDQSAAKHAAVAHARTKPKMNFSNPISTNRMCLSLASTNE